MNTTELRRRALATAGTVARHVPNDNAQLFAFISSPAVRAEPWALYQRLHRRGPIRPGPYGTWLVASHPAVTTLLRHSAVSVDETKANLPGSTSARDGAFTKLIDRTLLFTDPPDHARLRRLVSRDFTPRVVADLQPPIESLVNRLLDEFEHAGSGDLVESFAIPFPVAVICELLGIDQAERPRFLILGPPPRPTSRPRYLPRRRDRTTRGPRSRQSRRVPRRTDRSTGTAAS